MRALRRTAAVGLACAAAAALSAGCALVLGLEHEGPDDGGASDASTDVTADSLPGEDAPDDGRTADSAPADDAANDVADSGTVTDARPDGFVTTFCSQANGSVFCADFDEPGALGAFTLGEYTQGTGVDAGLADVAASPPASLGATIDQLPPAEAQYATTFPASEAGTVEVSLDLYVPSSCALQPKNKTFVVTYTADNTNYFGPAVYQQADAGLILVNAQFTAPGGAGGSSPSRGPIPVDKWVHIRSAFCPSTGTQTAEVGNVPPGPCTVDGGLPQLTVGVGLYSCAIEGQTNCTVYVDNVVFDEH